MGGITVSLDGERMKTSGSDDRMAKLEARLSELEEILRAAVANVGYLDARAEFHGNKIADLLDAVFTSPGEPVVLDDGDPLSAVPPRSQVA